MIPSEQFIYVDASWQVKTRKRTQFEPWQRVQLSQVETKIIHPSKNHNCFMSVQRYRDATSTRDRNSAGEAAEIGGDYQVHHCGLFFDFDAKPEEGEELADAIARAQVDTNALIDFFHTKFEDINPAHIQVWFSGGKGFHVTIRPEVFAIKPHKYLTYMIKNMVWSLAEELELKTLDRGVYTISRLWRIANSVHQKTGLRKVELTGQELKQLDAAQIMSIAKSPRLDAVWGKEEYENIAPIVEAVAWWDDWERYFDWQDTMYKLRPIKRVTRPAGEEGMPWCMKDLSDNGPKEDGRKRNHVAMVMATYWKDMGYSLEACTEEMDDWTYRHFGHRDSREIRENVANTRSAVKSVYADKKYAFTCAAIIACGNNKGPNPVPCEGAKCKWVPNAADQEPEELPTVHLSEASRGIYDGKQLRIPVHVSGKQEAPYGLPLQGKIRCPKSEEHRCKMCPFGEENAGGEHEKEWKLSAANREILSMIDVNDNMRKGAVKAFAGFPKECYKARVIYGEVSNIEALRLIPMVDYAQAYQEDAINKDEVNARSSEHAVRDAYYVGHGLQANKKYNLVAYTYQHPKDQRIVHVFEEAVPNQNDIQHFRLTDEMKEQLKVFQVKPGQDVAAKIYEIGQDLCENVHQIRGLQELSQALDLAFHSVIGFHFDGKFIEKGWFELLVVGDSSTGKSTMTKALIQHFRVGEMVAGEEAKRSGLVWASIQISGKWTLIWGKIPQNDRRLLVIDEFGEMDPDEVTKLTQLRSEGKAVGQGVSSEYETWARTRLIFLTNVRGSRDLSSFSRGVEAVAGIFKADADLRRTDLAVAVRKGEVPRHLVHKRNKSGNVQHKYTSDLCHNLILWAWSRNPKHIEFGEGSEDRIMELSQELGERYESDLYLVETNDMRHKLARVSCAVAARVFSTDERCTKVLVKIEHVEYAANLFDRCYGRSNPKSSMKYYQYAMAWQKKNDFTEERKNSFKHELDKFGKNRERVIWALIDIQDFRKADLNDQLAMPKEDFESFWTFLLGNQFVTRNYTGTYRKSGSLNDFLNVLAYAIDEEDNRTDKPPF